MGRANDTIYLVDNGGDLQRVPRHHYESEELLQRLIEQYPEILAGDQMAGNDTIRFIFVKREWHPQPIPERRCFDRQVVCFSISFRPATKFPAVFPKSEYSPDSL